MKEKSEDAFSVHYKMCITALLCIAFYANKIITI